MEVDPELEDNVQTPEKIFTTSHLTDECLQWVKSSKKKEENKLYTVDTFDTLRLLFFGIWTKSNVYNTKCRARWCVMSSLLLFL